MPEWQIESQEYFRRLNLSQKDFEKELHLPQIKTVKKILPLRELKVIESLIPIRQDTLLYLLKQIKTLNGKKPFKNIRISMFRAHPEYLKIGQKFVYRENYQKLLENAPNIFSDFLVNCGGLANLGAYFVFGRDENNLYCLACYIPPIIEKQGGDLVVMDGIHRNYITKQAGGTINAILVENVGLPFPCAKKEWSEIEVISLAHKPKDINARYFKLKKGLFRDLKYLGIDG